MALGLGMMLVAAARFTFFYRVVWHSVAPLILMTVLFGAALLSSSGAVAGLSALRQQQMILLLAMTAMCNLVQFRFAAPIYFSYVAPLVALTLSAVVTTRRGLPGLLLGSLVVFYTAFAVLVFALGFINVMGHRYYAPDPQTQPLTLARAGGLRADPDEAREYERLIPCVREHAGGAYMYAAPDAPEVYFLSGIRTRTLFEFLDDPEGQRERVLGALAAHGVKVIAILSEPQFSEPLEPDLREAC